MYTSRRRNLLARVRPIVGWSLLALVMSGRSASAQDANAWRAPFAAGEEARKAGDMDGYAREMAVAARAMLDGQLNRPFLQYHAARSAALVGRAEESMTWLRQAWDEDIESLMIGFATYDPAFAALLDSDGFRTVMALPATMSLRVTPLRGRVHRIVGAGANLLAVTGPDGVFLVDTGYLPALPALRTAIAGLSSGEVEWLLLTHPHEDHWGASEELGDNAVVLAHPGTAAAMDEPYEFMEGVEMPPKGAAARPEILIASDTSFVLNGEHMRVAPFLGHTGGDLVVYFADSRVAHFGDVWLGSNPMMFPGTADPDGFLDRLGAFLDAMDPETIVVGGHEEPVEISEVREQIAETRACMAAVRQALTDGLTVEETAERTEGRFAPQWVGFFYRLFTAA